MLYLNDPDSPLFSGSYFLICNDVKFYKVKGELTDGTKKYSNDEVKVCSEGGETNCIVKSGYSELMLVEPRKIKSFQEQFYYLKHVAVCGLFLSVG